MTTMDLHDQELMKSFQMLSPLLQASSRYIRESAEEPNSKRPKQEDDEQVGRRSPTDPALQGAVLTVLGHMTKLLIQHEKQLQQLQRQDSFVLFIQASQQGGITILQQLATDWKSQLAQHQTDPNLLNMRTYLFRGLMKEVHLRLRQMSSSKLGEPLWDKAIEQGVLLPCGSWPFQKWDPTNKKLVRSHKQPLGMQRVLNQFSYLEELLSTNDQIVRFHSLRPQPTVVPWMVQTSLRMNDVWGILTEMANSTLWSLLGLSLKVHSQTLSRPAQLLQDSRDQTGHLPQKGRGKGKQNGKHQKKP